MQQNYQTIKFPTAASQTTFTGGATWLNPTNILADDANDATLSLAGSGAAELHGQNYGIEIPPGGIIDGVAVYIDSPFQNGGWLSISIDLGIAGTTAKPITTVNGTYGGPTDLWGKDSISAAEIAAVETNLFALGTVDDNIYVNYINVIVYWHIDLNEATAEVPTRVVHKVYSRDGKYLGELPNVTSPFGFSQDISSAGSMIEIVCGTKAENLTTVDPLLTDDDEIILTDDDLPILASSTDVVIANGASNNDAIFKNSNRIKTWLYNYWYPNGKLIFSGQVNRVAFKYGVGKSNVQLSVLSDGLDMSNFIARGYPFTYTTDVSQTTTIGAFPVTFNPVAGWDTFGQTWTTGPAVTNIGAIVLRLKGNATVTLSIYDAPNGNFMGSVTKAVSAASPTDIQFEYAQLIEVLPSTSYFFAIWLAPGQTIDLYRTTADVYSGGTRYRSQFSGGGGGSFIDIGGEVYFIAKSGVPTTTTTYSSDDPVTEMMTGILLDYNARGGYITERDFQSTGLSLTYTFNQATIFDAMKKVLELSPTGYYSYIDLGTAEMDILPISSTADFTIVKGKDINELSIVLSIEQVKNYLLFTGGPAPTTNLYRDYQDTESTGFYGIRTVARTDNRVTLAATANAIGSTFIEENAGETQETQVTIPVTSMDTTLLVPGKTIGFRNFGNFIDDMVLQIVRRDFTTKAVTLTLGRLPVRMNDEIQRINRGLLNEQTANNPSAPS